MPRYLIRAGSAGDWTVWDRARRGPAVVGDRKLVRLSREAAEAALARLLAAEPQPDQPTQMAGQWQVLYGHQIIDCRDEHEARTVARGLIRKGAKVAARLIQGDRVVRLIEGRIELRSWASN
jgi:hypothetical protein